MKDTNRKMVLLAGCVVVIIASCALAGDWPQWRGTNRDGKVSGFTAPQAWPKELTQKWKTTVGSGDATPALVGEAQAVTRPADSHPGPRSSPAVAGGKVVTLGVGGVLSCLEAATGKLVWRKDPFPKVVPRFFTSFSPIVVGGTAIAHLGGQGNGAIIAYDLATGSEKWRWGEEGPDYGSPALLTAAGTRQIVTPTEKSIVGISVADGKLLWQLPFEPPRRAYNSATPIIDGQTVIYTGKGRGTKAVKIEKQGDGFVAKELWSNPDLAPQFTTPVLRDGLLFGLSDGNKLYCINAETGQTAWTDATARGSRGFGSIVGAGSCLAVLANDSELIVFKPDGKQYSEIMRYKVAETPTYAHPVITGNKVYVKDNETVTLWAIE
jgi:outer membrane protein assembly factor BamB